MASIGSADAPPPTDSSDQRSVVLIALMKGVIYRENAAAVWQSLQALQAHVRDYVAVLGLELILDDNEGYAYLRQRVATDGAPELPRLVPRRPLGYPVSLLLALLRKKLAESDATSGDTRLIVTRDDIVELIRLYMPDTANEARVMDRLETHVKRVVELGFLRRMEGRDDHYEVMRILKTFVDAQWLQSFNDRLAEYRTLHSPSDATGEPE